MGGLLNLFFPIRIIPKFIHAPGAQTAPVFAIRGVEMPVFTWNFYQITIAPCYNSLRNGNHPQIFLFQDRQENMWMPGRDGEPREFWKLPSRDPTWLSHF